MATADLLLHPIRMRIIKAFLGDRALTTSQLAAELDDVPSGSVYRHVALLTNAGVLQVVAERRVRGAVERTYTLRLFAARIGPGEAEAMSADEHAQAFMAYVAGMLADADRYLAAGKPDPARDGDDSPLALNCVFHDGQSQAGTSGIACPRLIHAIESLEDPR